MRFSLRCDEASVSRLFAHELDLAYHDSLCSALWGERAIRTPIGRRTGAFAKETRP
jgi:hypothetical protein